MAGVAVGGTSSLSSKASRNPSKSIFLVLVRNKVGHVHLAAAGWLALLAAGWGAIFKGRVQRCRGALDRSRRAFGRGGSRSRAHAGGTGTMGHGAVPSIAQGGLGARGD